MCVLYAISSVLAIIIDSSDLYFLLKIDPPNYSFSVTFLYCFLLTLVIWPFRRIDVERIFNKKLSVKQELLLEYFFYLMFIVFFIKIAAVLPNLFKIFKGDIGEYRYTFGDGSDYETGGTSTFLVTLDRLLSLFFGRFSPLLIFLYFYWRIVNPTKKGKNILVLLSSLTPVLGGLSLAGRTQAAYWILLFFAVFILVKKKLSIFDLKKMRLFGLAIFILFYFYNSIVVSSRWGAENNLNNFIVYLGQPFINFTNVYNSGKDEFVSFDRIIPILSSLRGENFDLNEYREHIMIVKDLNIGIFYTFLGDLFVDLGSMGMIIFVIIFSVIVNFFQFYKKSTTLSGVIMLILFIQLPIHGLFYYSFWRLDMFFYVLGSIILSYTLVSFPKN